MNELFQARHGLLAVRTMAALSAAIYGRMATLQRVSPDGRVLVADVADQFDRVPSVADGEKDYLQGVIDFYQTVLTLRAKDELRAHARAQLDPRLSSRAASWVADLGGARFDQRGRRTWLVPLR